MDASLYNPLYLTLVGVLCIPMGIKYFNSSDNTLLSQRGGYLWPLLIGVALIFWLGFRPVSGRYFGDTSNYARIYDMVIIEPIVVDWAKEWLWGGLMIICRSSGLNVSEFFTIVEAGYILSVLWAIRRLMPGKPMLAFLFILSSFSFYTYGINGIRNGFACHMFILALSYLVDRRYVVGAFLCLATYGIHRSIMLPIAAALVSIFFIKSPRTAIRFWIISIPLSLVAGGAITNFFASLGFDDRMSHYSSAGADMSEFSHTGFRWDFLLYSAMPVWLTWYVTVKRRINDRVFNIISTTYILSNAFWVMVIASSFSNRFAYLSWFLYPVVIAYPLINLRVWKDQDHKTGLILLAYCGFTLFMGLVY